MSSVFGKTLVPTLYIEAYKSRNVHQLMVHRNMLYQSCDLFDMARDGNRSKRSEQKGLLRSVRCFKVKTQFGSMLDVLNRAPARFESSILKVLLGSIKLGPSCSIRLDIA